MDLRIFTEPQQGASYSQLLAAAQTTEAAGFDAFFRSDHYLKMGGVSGLPGPTDAWVTLAGLARETSRIRLGTLVSPVTFYQPGQLAIAVAQVDDMSGGRIDFGFGAGWYEAEHTAYGLPFPDLGERMSRMEEALEQIVGLWTTPEGGEFNHDGEFHSFSQSPALPQTFQKPHPPIIVGGAGKKRTPRMAARYAAEFNVPFAEPGKVPGIMSNIDRSCEAIDRDPATLIRSAAVVLCAGADDATVTRRANTIGREVGEMSENGFCGTFAELEEKASSYRELGITRLYLQVLDITDVDHIAETGAALVDSLASL